MPLSDKIQQLEDQIRQRIEETFGEMRQEVLERFRSQSESLREQLEALSVGLPDHLFDDADLQPVLEEVSQEVRQQESVKAERAGVPAAELREALAALDTARSQGDLLQALLIQCGRFCSRSAVFLAQPGQLQGWGGHGLGEAEASLKAMVVEAPEGSSWHRLLSGDGVVELGSTERAALASRLEIPVARTAVLLPLMLRDRVAAAVYVDRVDDASLPVDGLQTLTYVAALAIETLPLRKRESTPTLSAFASPGPSPRAPLSDTPFPQTAPTTEEPPQEAPEIPPPAPTPVTEVPHAAPPTERTVEPEVEPIAAAPVEPEPVEELAASPAAEAELDEMDLGEVDLEVDEEVELEDFQADSQLEGTPTSEAPEPSLTAAPSYEAPSYEAPAAAEPAPPSEGLTAGPETEVVDEELVVGAEPPAWTLEEAPSETPAEAAEAEPPPVAEAPSAEPAVAAPEAEAPEAAAPPAAPAPSAPARGPEDTHSGTGGSAEVAPPSDVQGPGWAFAGTEEMDGDEEARHEEAKRLARLLVSEIKLYNEEHVMEGRQNNDIFERLKDDIERSRQLYDARVDERVREKTDYFYQEMVRVLGAGDPKTLGI